MRWDGFSVLDLLPLERLSYIQDLHRTADPCMILFSKGIQGAQGRSTSLHTSGPLALVPRRQISCYLQGRASRMGRYDANLLDSKPTRANSKRTNIAPKQSSTMLTETLEQTFYCGMHALSTAGVSQTVWMFQQGTKELSIRCLCLRELRGKWY